MTKADFLKIMYEFSTIHKNDKDGGWNEVRDLSSYIADLNIDQQDSFIAYCIDEVKQSENIDYYLELIINLHNKSAITLLYHIFINMIEMKNDNSKSIVSALFELRDCDNEHHKIYDDYMNSSILTEFNTINYHVVLKYMYICPEKSIKILIQYFSLMFADKRLRDSIKENLVTFLSYCELSSFENLYMLMREIQNVNGSLYAKIYSLMKDISYSKRFIYNKNIKIELQKFIDGDFEI